jgi:hypothetical protein
MREKASGKFPGSGMKPCFQRTIPEAGMARSCFSLATFSASSFAFQAAETHPFAV